MLNNLIWYLLKIKNKITNKNLADFELPYRHYLFNELVQGYPDRYFEGKRVLEIGPRDGEDTFRLDWQIGTSSSGDKIEPDLQKL